MKSEEELRLIQKSEAILDLGIEVARNAMRPGRKVQEIMAEIRYALIQAAKNNG